MPLKTEQIEEPNLNLTPMIDIVFLLIIFFMVGTKFTELEQQLQLELPQISAADQPNPQPVNRVINVYRDGRVALEQELLSLDELIEQLRSARTQHNRLGVIVRGDADGPLQNVATVLGACRQAGISDLGISVRLAKKE